MAGLPVTVRLLDPPLHEFLPNDEASQKEMAKRLGVKPADVKAEVESGGGGGVAKKPPINRGRG